VSRQRYFAVKEGRAMVRVRSLKTAEPATIGVCPACWNIRERRRVLLVQLKKMGYEPAYRDDRLDGRYRTEGKRHAPGCRYSRLQADPWQRFRSELKRHRR
jgi:hypothetical protein